MSPLIFVSGISGVGKTTLVERARVELAFHHARASELIQNGLSKLSLNVETLGDLERNQAALVSGLRDLQGQTTLPIVLDGHTIIFSESGAFKVGIATFASLRPTAMLTLIAQPDEVSVRRQNDRSRVRPSFRVDELSRQQDLVCEEAANIAGQLKIPHSVAANEEEFIALLTLHIDM